MRAVWGLLLLVGAVQTAGAQDPGLPSPEPSYTKAYVAAGVGVALTGLSFWLAEEADQAYAEYESGSEPDQIQSDYDRTTELDRLSAATLIAGQASLALAVYWRFLRKPAGGLAGARAASRFEPILYPGGFAVRVRF